MTGLELVVGYLAAWGVRKARRMGARADNEVDRALDAGMDQLHELVAAKLAGDPALARLEEQAAGGEVSASTRQRVQLALEDAGEDEPEFLAALDALTRRLQATEGNGVALAGHQGVSVVGGVDIHAETGGLAAWQVGDVTMSDAAGRLGGRGDPSGPGRSLG